MVLHCAVVLALGLELAGCNCHQNTDLGESSSSTSPETGDSTEGTVSGSAATTTTTTSEPSTSGGEQETTGTTGGDGQCHGTDDCGTGFCVAAYADNHRDPFACVDACVGPQDESSWCYDTAACCDPLAVCTTRGYCEAPGADSSSSSDDGTGADSSSSTGGSSSTG